MNFRRVVSRTIRNSLLMSCAILLCGCDKLYPFLLSSRSASPTVMLVAGQSNASRFAWWGTRPLYSKIPGVVIVDCSVGSTVVDSWVVGGHYWNSCMEMLHGKAPNFVFWWQGENNTYAGYGSGFLEKTTAILNGFRRLNPQVRIFYAQLGANNSGINYPDWQSVQDQQAQIYLPNATMILTKDLQTNSTDGIHMTPESEVSVGERVADEL